VTRVGEIPQAGAEFPATLPAVDVPAGFRHPGAGLI
jgi:hypothetical protein